MSTARFKAIDTLRRRARFDASQEELVRYFEAQLSSAEKSDEEDSLEDGFEDDHRWLRPTGGRLLRFTIDWYEFILRQLHS
jgi:predicted RNA polymerase sigma factor